MQSWRRGEVERRKWRSRRKKERNRERRDQTSDKDDEENKRRCESHLCFFYLWTVLGWTTGPEKAFLCPLSFNRRILNFGRFDCFDWMSFVRVVFLKGIKGQNGNEYGRRINYKKKRVTKDDGCRANKQKWHHSALSFRDKRRKKDPQHQQATEKKTKKTGRQVCQPDRAINSLSLIFLVSTFSFSPSKGWMFVGKHLGVHPFVMPDRWLKWTNSSPGAYMFICAFICFCLALTTESINYRLFNEQS